MFGSSNSAGNEDTDGQGIAPDEIVDNNGCVYVPDVVMNGDIYYFDIPRLGSYFAVPIKVKSYLNDQSFDDAIQKVKVYNEQVAENEAIKKAKDDEYSEKIEAARQSDPEELARLEQEYNEIVWEEVPYPDFEPNLLNYVLCCDTLGKDREISQTDRDFVFDLCEHYRSSWEDAELQAIKDQVAL